MPTIVEPSEWTANTDPGSTLLEVGGSTYWVQNGGDAYAITSPAANTLRFELHPGDVWTEVDPSSKERTEIAGSSSFATGANIHVSYGFQVEPGQTNDASWLVTGQFHQTANDGRSPPFEIDLVGDRMAVEIATGSTYKQVYIDPENIVRGHTYQIEIDAEFDATDGHLTVVRDGVTIVDYDGPMGWADMGSVYWKEGIYRSASDTSIAIDYSDLSVSNTDPSHTVEPPVVVPPVVVPPAVEPPGDSVSGGVAADTITGSDHPNTLFGGGGDDLITGGASFNRVNGNLGQDTIVGHSTVGDWLLGGQGNDSIDAAASSGPNIINGNTGADLLAGGSGVDTLRGGQGDDVIHAGSNGAWISGDLGTNALYGGQGRDTFHAGAGHDTVTGWQAGDHVLVDPGVTFTPTQVNSDVHIVFSDGGEMDLLNTQLNSLQSGWIANV